MIKQFMSKLFCGKHSLARLQKSSSSSLTRTTAIGVQPSCHHGNSNYGNHPYGNSQFNTTLTESLHKGQFSRAPALNLTFVRTAYYAYRPNALKRIRKHGLEKRLSCRSQREILFRKIINGKKVLTVFDRFTNIYPEKVDKTKRVNLFDPKRGFRKFIKKPNIIDLPEVLSDYGPCIYICCTIDDAVSFRT